MTTPTYEHINRDENATIALEIDEPINPINRIEPQRQNNQFIAIYRKMIYILTIILYSTICMVIIIYATKYNKYTTKCNVIGVTYESSEIGVIKFTHVKDNTTHIFDKFDDKEFNKAYIIITDIKKGIRDCFLYTNINDNVSDQLFFNSEYAMRQLYVNRTICIILSFGIGFFIVSLISKILIHYCIMRGVE